MQPIRITKRLAEITAPARRRLTKEVLTAGDRNALLNALNKIDLWGSKVQAQLERPLHYQAHYDAKTEVDYEHFAGQCARIWALLIEGRKVSVEDAEMVNTTAFATRMSDIRKKIDRHNLPYILCDAWFEPGDGRSHYKQYWLEDKPQEGQKL